MWSCPPLSLISSTKKNLLCILNQPLIMSLHSGKLVMSTSLYNFALVHYDNLITISDCRETMGSDDAGASPSLYVVKNLLFYDRVKCAGCLIHNQNTWIRYQCPGNLNSLPLSS